MIYDNMNEEEYRQLEGVNISRLKLMKYSPRHFKENVSKESPFLQLGSLVDEFVFDKERAEKDLKKTKVFPGIKRGKAWELFKIENYGCPIMTQGELDRVKKAADIGRRVRSHPWMKQQLRNKSAFSQAVVTWEKNGIACKGRIDLLSDTIVDLKTTSHMPSFLWQMERYGYWNQASWYQDGVEANTGEVRPFVILAIESAPPFGVKLFNLPDHEIRNAAQENYKWLLEMRDCQNADFWPDAEPEIARRVKPFFSEGLEEENE